MGHEAERRVQIQSKETRASFCFVLFLTSPGSLYKTNSALKTNSDPSTAYDNTICLMALAAQNSSGPQLWM